MRICDRLGNLGTMKALLMKTVQVGTESARLRSLAVGEGLGSTSCGVVDKGAAEGIFTTKANTVRGASYALTLESLNIGVGGREHISAVGTLAGLSVRAGGLGARVGSRSAGGGLGGVGSGGLGGVGSGGLGGEGGRGSSYRSTGVSSVGRNAATGAPVAAFTVAAPAVAAGLVTDTTQVLVTSVGAVIARVGGGERGRVRGGERGRVRGGERGRVRGGVRGVNVGVVGVGPVGVGVVVVGVVGVGCVGVGSVGVGSVEVGSVEVGAVIVGAVDVGVVVVGVVAVLGVESFVEVGLLRSLGVQLAFLQQGCHFIERVDVGGISCDGEAEQGSRSHVSTST